MVSWTALWRVPIFALIWMAFLLIKVPTLIAGWVVVPYMYKYRGTLYDKLPAWTRPWSNPEDWKGGPKTFVNSLPKWWVTEQIEGKSRGSGFWSFYQYHALRNGANGLRSFELLDLDIVEDEVLWFGTSDAEGFPLEKYEPWYVRPNFTGTNTYWYFAWQGWQAGFKFVHHWNENRHFVCKLGWRVEPNDAYEPIDPKGIRHDDAGFATKLLPWREG